MDEFCKRLGVFVIAAVMFALPILCTCSCALRWDADVVLVLVLLTMTDFGFCLGCVSAFVDEWS